MADPLDVLQRLGPFLDRMEQMPDRPFSQAEIDQLREAMTTVTRIVSFLKTLGWLGKWLLWLLGVSVLVMSQLDAVAARFRGWFGW